MVMVAASALLYFGCGGEDEDRTTNPNVLSERQLKTQDVIHVNENHTVLLSLEHPSLQQDAYDLHHIGSDCYRIRPTADLEEIELFIEGNVSVASVSIRDLQSHEHVTVTRDDNGTTFTFKQNRMYEFCVTHDGTREMPQPLFVRFVDTDKSTSGLGYDTGAIDTLKTTNKCIGCDLSNYDFSFNMPDLSGVDISEANLSGSVFYKVILDGAHLNAAILDGADLSRVSMIRTRMEHVKTLNKTISNYSFTPINIDYASFAHSDLRGFDMGYYPRYELLDINFSSANLSGTNTNMKDRNFSNSVFRGADLSRAHLESTHFNGVDLSSAKLVDAFLDNMHFYHVNFDESNLTGASSVDAIVHKPTGMKKVQMPGFNLGGSDLGGLDLSRSNFIGADFSGTSLRDTTCTDVNFSNAIFTKTDLTHTTMDYSDFRGSTLQDAIFLDTTTTIIEPKSFIGVNISGIKFHPDAYLWFINFSHSICHETDFSETDLGNSNFSYAECQGAVFSDTKIMIANFSNANLLHSNVDDADTTMFTNFSNAIWSNGRQCRNDPCPYYDYIGKRVCSGKCL